MISIYTDGSCSGNGSKNNFGGYGVVVTINNKIIKQYSIGKKNTTNNEMELEAILYAIKFAKILNKNGIQCDAIHGNKSQNARQRALTNFKTGKTHVIIATDIAARGIDIDNLQLVINYDLPDVAETYVHRIGRTGRAGHNGSAITFCSSDERVMLRDIQKLTGKKLNVVAQSA